MGEQPRTVREALEKLKTIVAETVAEEPKDVPENPGPSINILQMGDILNRILVIERHPQSKFPWSASFSGMELREGVASLVGCRGHGMSAQEALDDFVGKVRGHTVVFTCTSERLEEYYIPKYVESVVL